MQLRKVCNHPDMFEPRPTVSPYRMERLEFATASCAWTATQYDPFKVSREGDCYGAGVEVCRRARLSSFGLQFFFSLRDQLSGYVRLRIQSDLENAEGWARLLYQQV